MRLSVLMPSLHYKCFCCFCFGNKKNNKKKTNEQSQRLCLQFSAADGSSRGKIKTHTQKVKDFFNSVESIHRAIVSQRCSVCCRIWSVLIKRRTKNLRVLVEGQWNPAEKRAAVNVKPGYSYQQTALLPPAVDTTYKPVAVNC